VPQLASDQLCSLRKSDKSRASTGNVVSRATAWQGIAHLDDQRASGGATNAYLRDCTVRMLADIGQPLLHDAISSTADNRGDRVDVDVLVVLSDVQASIA
jgi:hypothetical protein